MVLLHTSFSFLGLPEGVKDDITTPIIIAVLILAAVAAGGAAGVFVYKKRSGEGITLSPDW